MWRIVGNALLICGLAFMTAPTRAAELVYSTLLWQGDFLGIFKTAGGVRGAIHSIQDDGTNDKTVVDMGGFTSNPLFSPDGKWLYFQSNAGGSGFSIYRSRADGKEVSNLGGTAQLDSKWKAADSYGTSLSGDGKKMVYTLNDGKTATVVYANSDGTDAQLVAPQLGYIYQAALNTTGGIAVFSSVPKNYQLYSAQLPSGNPEMLTPDMTQCYGSQFTPDGKAVIFIHCHTPNPLPGVTGYDDGDVASLDLATNKVTELTRDNKYVHFYVSASTDVNGSTDAPSISNDGKRIAYIGMVNGVPQVHTMNLDGSEQKQITFGTTPSGRVGWSPDGKMLAFVTFVDKYPQLFVVNAEGGTPRQLTHVTGGCIYSVKWRPENSK